jgi:hypothetical protein
VKHNSMNDFIRVYILHCFVQHVSALVMNHLQVITRAETCRWMKQCKKYTLIKSFIELCSTIWFIIQGVPLPTKPGISLIILKTMKILKRDLNRSMFVVWEMKRNVSVMCDCFVAKSSLFLELLKKCQVWYVVGHPTLPFCNASRHIILPFCHTITKDQSNDINIWTHATLTCNFLHNYKPMWWSATSSVRNSEVLHILNMNFANMKRCCK